MKFIVISHASKQLNKLLHKKSINTQINFCTNLTSNEIFSLAIVGILTTDVYTENWL